ncbi:hypothetical protein GR160_05700 [Flavobacterium sp. Sd200]|uniref:hypothetical protein n=1 Tax=Flavobacterium sp. Sd200 TaxID=2692211 RepID=UPI00136E2C51|nr:hypothetical protein [Flavobacterium sp. Sd200]MXN90714.1 hypothetical protein [Flavobacterium sp. Sd200]
MKNILFLTLLLLAANSLWAQGDNGSMGGIAIPRTSTVKPDTTVKPSSTSISPDSPFAPKPDTKKSFNYTPITIGEKKPNFSMNQTSEFVNRTNEYADRTTVKPEGESNKAYRGNQSFGEIRTKSKFMQVMARDFGAEDGDRIKIMVNDRIIVDEIYLTNSFKGVQITLDEGFNKLDFEALNQGTSGPNTAEFRVYDDKENMISGNQWNLATGFKASLMVIKE